ncbi:hypothetical protein BDY19DRAFT_926011 [Irpex rosettiformis]|uniref:Uncharacterized protein n=1 Tax=Irpex rosettiformis TaxID=378272 RepID=A0ACB8UEH4_9APHY|nr:hypothetical protein BDY19DRAFT_926011 [Irpex rosettiformis]
MSSISFPHAAHDHTASSSSPIHEDSYFNESNAAFATSSSSSFQMNPLSSHPPRTPRTSSVSSHQIYGGDIYTPKEENIEDQPEYFTDDEEDKAQQEARKRVRREAVWREMLKTSYGRDKAFKIIQYSMRLYLLFHTTLSSSRIIRLAQRPLWEKALVKKFETAIAHFSLTRKLLILFNWLSPLDEILAQHAENQSLSASRSSKQKAKPFLHTFLHASPPTLLELANGLSDDVYTMSRIGLIGKRTGERVAYWADCCWFLSTLVNLVENGVERNMIVEQQKHVESRLYDDSMLKATAKSNPKANMLDAKELARLQRQDHWIVMSRWKLIMDLIFVSYNVFNLKKAKSSIQTFTGLAAAILSAAKAYERHKTDIIKANKY